MRTTGLLVVAGIVALAPVVGAQAVSDRVAKAMPSRYIGATCDLSSGHFLVSSAALYLKTGTEQSDPEKSASAYASGVRVATQAITEAGQEGNAAAWYNLGRVHLQLGDLTGADSAFSRAAKLAPDCAEDIKSWRQRAFLPLMNPGTEFFRSGKSDSALVLFRQAAMIAPALPQSWYNAGVLFANDGQTDSAIVYLRRAKDIAATNAKDFGNDRNSATFNLAAMLQRAGRHEEAVTELQAYTTWDPSDVDAKRALSQSLRAIGRVEEAAKLDQELLAAAEASGTLTAGDLMGMGVTFFNEKKYAEAAEAFEKLLVKEPHNRDALFNLANAMYALDNGEKLITTAQRLVAAEPLSEDSRKLLSQGYRLINNQDKLLEAVTRLVEMPTSAVITAFRPTATGATLEGEATGRPAQTLEGREVPPAPKTLHFEFIDAAHAVVASADVAIPALQASAKHEFNVAVEAAGIVGWRYTVK